MRPGDVLGDRYRITSLLGRGGMGEVYVAHDDLLGRDVAVKVGLGDASATKVEAEARVIAGLDHPNVVPVHDVGTQDGRPYFVMALVEGDTLATRLADGPLPVDEAIDVALGVADGLHEAHRRGVVHRDVKPSNILLGEDGRPRVTDFGIAAAIDADLTTVRGSLAWTPPEQARGDVTVRGDVYGLGCVLTAMLTGAPPYRATTPAEELAQHQTGPLPDLRSRNPAVPAAVQAVVHRMLAKDPADRPADMTEVAARLRAAAVGGDHTETLRPSGTAVLPDPGPTRVLEAHPDDARPDQRGGGAVPADVTADRGRRRVPPVLVAVGAVALLLAMVAVATGRDGGPEVAVAPDATPTTNAPTTEAAASTTPPPSAPDTPAPAPTPTRTAPTTVAEAAADVRRVLAAARRDGQVSGEAVDKVEERLDKTLEAFRAFEDDGKEKDARKSLEELERLVEEVDDREGSGIAPDVADELRASASRLRDLLAGRLGDAADRGGGDDDDDDEDDEDDD